MAWILEKEFAQHRRGGWRKPLLCMLLALGGCTSLVNPYIDATRVTPTYVPADPFPDLRRAAENSEALRKTALQYRNEHVVTRSLLSYGVFGAAAAGGVAALYGASRDLVLGFGLGATAGYAAGELFVGADKITIYSAAGRALNCVVTAADGAVATGKSLTDLTSEDNQDTAKSGAYHKDFRKLDDLLKDPSINWPPEDPRVTDAYQAEGEYLAAIINIQAFKSRDSEFAYATDQTTRLILEVMEQRLEAVQPSFDAILRAAEAIGGQGVAYAKRVTPPAQEGAPGAPLALGLAGTVSKPTPAQWAQLTALTLTVKQAATKINEGITSATNRLGQVGTLCALNLPAAVALSTSQKQVTLGRDQTVTLVFSGGKLPLTYVWRDKTPASDQIEVAMSSGREIFLIGKSALPPGETYHLLVRDSLAAPGEVEIEVKAAAGRLVAQPDQVTLTVGTPASVTLSGGTGKYEANWVGTGSPPNIELEVAGSTVKLTAKEGATQGEYTVLAGDTGSPAQIVTIKVKIP